MTGDALLSVRGSTLVDRNGTTVVLRGFGLGGWMNMENFITGYPANEEAHRRSVRRVLGERRYHLFFDRFLEYFFTEEDARYIASLGLNLVRLPINYRHFEDDMRPFEIDESGFRHLDRVVDLCARHGIYTIIDLHALPGYQNQHWHSDNPTHRALLWQHKHFQDRTVHLWEAIARRYRGNPWVAGYNPINEPADPSEEMIMPFYARLYEAIRAHDPDHVIFLEGNRYSQDFHIFGEPWENVVYTNHDYALPGFVDGGPYPGVSRGTYVDREVLEETFRRRSAYMLERGLHVWVGEFGPVYTGDPEADAMRYRVLRDQLEIYRRYGASWAVWLYKDIGLQGVACAAPDSAWMRRVEPMLRKKARLGADSWGGTEEGITEVMGPIRELFAREFPDYAPFPFGAPRDIQELVRHILLSEPMVEEFAELFRGVTDEEIDTLMRSFLFENCRIRTPLAEVLAEHSGTAAHGR
ncbi:glycoside hydrolase family 5 protein [Streptomonospora wellingtoniae]|uniref:Glycoside hydrolase family 5 protein n=1 Tax=Streptomonospora wellingtoniae TaxID=3075544 RepID=A0ABU2KNQ1_9ACTN|nr:glycoside hydrolase family 5 protein [Streptomonospora sp. DSM 45055]MDT0300899.1 glycoside hydrolase family 5 protein [Streptomonospora sp. DSM 45055]